MRQLLTISKLVFVKAWRGNLLPGLILVLLPLLYAAWAFEAENPGFQTGFIADVSGSIMSLLAALLLVILGFEHFFWPAEQRIPWFFLSRTGNRSVFAAGKFVGVASVLFVALFSTALIFFVMMLFSEGQCFFSLLITAVLVFYEAALICAVFQLLAAVSSKLTACGCLLVIYVVGQNLSAIRAMVDAYGSVAVVIANFLLALLPDLSLFNSCWYSDFNLPALFFVTAYAALQTTLYLAVTGLILQRKDL